MFTFLKRLFQMTLMLVVTILVTAMGLMYWIWHHREQLTQYQVSLAIHEFAPDWDFRLAAASLTTDGRLILRDFQLKDPIVNTTMLHVPTIELAINWELYQRTQHVEVARVELQRPLLDVRKLSDGTWTITNLPPVKSTGKKSPPLTITDGTVRISADDPIIGQTVQYALHNLDLEIKTTDENILQIACTADGGQAGKLQLRGAYSIPNQTFLLEGDLDQLQFGNSLVDLVLAMLPDLKPHVDQFHARIAPPQATLTQTASLTPWDADHPTASPSQLAPENLLQTRLLADLKFSIARTQAGSPLDLTADLDIAEGYVDHPRFPMALQRLEGSIHLDEHGLRISQMKGMSGATQLDLSGEFPLQIQSLNGSSTNGIRFISDSKPGSPPAGMIVNVSGVPINDRIRETASKGIKGILDHLNLTGTLDVQTRVRVDETGVHSDLVALTIRDGTARAKSFPYPVTAVQGTVKQDPSSATPRLIYEMTGLAGERPVRVTGWTRNPGPDHETFLDISFADLPLDETFISALPDHVETVVRKFHIGGLLMASHKIYFPQGNKLGYQQKSQGHFKQASLNWDLFPYQIDDVEGDISLDREIWTFSNVSGRHVDTLLSASGTISPQAPEYINNFEIVATNGHFDQALRHAVRVAHANCDELWQIINPQGNFDATVRLRQHRLRGCEVELPSITTHDAQVNFSFLPYRWDKVKSQLSYIGETVTIESVSAQHATTLATAKGVLTRGPQFWTARLDDLYVDNVIPNDELVRALPVNLQGVIHALKIKDPMSIRGAVEFKGTYEKIAPTLTSAWDLVFNIASMTLDLDIPVEKMTGSVSMQGILVDEKVEMRGRLDLDSLFFMGYPVTQLNGPFTMVNNQVVFGSSQTFGAQTQGAPKSVALTDRIQGRIFEGIVSLDSVLTLNENFDYRSRVELTRASLANWAQLNGYGASQIRGNMNGWLDLTGQGSEMSTVNGRGQLWIDQAELYELPMFIRLFNVLKFVPPDKTAFRYAFADFGIANKRLNFDQIEFIGSSIGMSGTGHIRMDDRVMSLDFVSKIPRNQSPIPLVNSIMDIPMLRQATEGIVQVHVGGKVQAPEITTSNGFLGGNAIRRFQNNFNFNPDYQAPNYGPPPTFSRPVPR